MSSPKVSIIMGSQSDWQDMEHASKLLTELGVNHECKIISAHRTPQRHHEYVTTAKERGVQVIIAGAGMAAHLAGVTAALTTLPVLGVPMKSDMHGIDSLLSTVQMPGGIPVGTLGVGKHGAKNAALLASGILALNDAELDARLTQWREKQTDNVPHEPQTIQAV